MRNGQRETARFHDVFLLPSARLLSDHTPYLSGKDYQWWSFPNNLLLNFPADWPSSSTAYMLSQGDSTPGPTLERLSHQYYSAKQPLKENSFRWPSGDLNRGPSVPQSESLPLDYRLASPITSIMKWAFLILQQQIWPSWKIALIWQITGYEWVDCDFTSKEGSLG